MNGYGLNKSDLQFKIEDLSVYKRYGYQFKQSNGKTYVISPENYLVSIIDNEMTLKDVETIIDKTFDKYQKFTYNEYNSNILTDFINEVESKTGKKVSSASFDNGKYIFVVDGDEIEIPYSEDGSINVLDVLDKVEVKENHTYLANDRINEDNKKVIENYLTELLSTKVNLILNENDQYEVIVNDKIITVLNKDANISEALATIDNELNRAKSLDNFSPDIKTIRLQAKTTKSNVIHVDVNLFNEILAKHTSAKDIIEGCKGIYSTSMIDGELLESYNRLVSANTNPQTRINKTSELLNDITLSVKYSLQAYENIDHHLGVIFNSLVSQIFSINSYKDEKTKEFYENDMTFENREQYLKDIIKVYESNLSDLKSEYEKIYGHGVEFSNEEASLIMGVINGFNLHEGVIAEGFNGDNTIIDPEKLSYAVGFIKDHDVFNKLKKYADGMSWKKSGLSSLNQYILGWKTGDYDDNTNEQEFLFKYLEVQNQDLIDDLTKKYNENIDNLVYMNNIVALKDIKLHLSNQLELSKTITLDTGDKISLNPLALLEYYYDDKKAINESIVGLENTIYNYKQYQALMPFDADMKTTKYLDYLVRDYSDINLKESRYLSQSELALYTMYMETGQGDKAKNYLVAMNDLINQRKGYEDAAERIMAYGGVDGFLKSGWDGCIDGFEKFIDGIENVFNSDGKRSAEDYRDMYMLSLLGEENIFNQDLSSLNRDALAWNYKIMSSIGQQAIPTLAYFVPGGKVMSTVLMGLSSFGNSTEMAMQSGAGGAESYLYGTLSGVSTVVLNKLMSGIAGLNGNTKALDSVKGYLQSIPQQMARTAVGTYLDGGLRSTILGQPFDLVNLSGQAFDAAIQGAFTSSIMNGVNKCLLTIANGVTIEVTGSTYSEFCKDLEDKMWNTSAGQKVAALMTAGNELWDNYCQRHPYSLFVRMAELYRYNHSADLPIKIDRDTAKKMGISLSDGERILYNPNTECYQRIDAYGNVFNIPSRDINNYEGSMYIKLTREEQLRLALRNISDTEIDSFGKVLRYLRGYERLDESDKKILLNRTVAAMVDGLDDDTSKAIKIYSELTKLLHYDEEFGKSDREYKERMTSKFNLHAR